MTHAITKLEKNTVRLKSAFTYKNKLFILHAVVLVKQMRKLNKTMHNMM